MVEHPQSGIVLAALWAKKPPKIGAREPPKANMIRNDHSTPSSPSPNTQPPISAPINKTNIPHRVPEIAALIGVQCRLPLIRMRQSLDAIKVKTAQTTPTAGASGTNETRITDLDKNKIIKVATKKAARASQYGNRSNALCVI